MPSFVVVAEDGDIVAVGELPTDSSIATKLVVVGPSELTQFRAQRWWRVLHGAGGTVLVSVLECGDLTTSGTRQMLVLRN